VRTAFPLAAGLAAAALGLGPAGDARADLLIVLNKSGHEAALVDPASLEVRSTLPTGKGPHEVAVSPDGRRAYVTDYGAYAVFKEGERPSYSPGRTLTVLDLGRRAVAATWDLGEHRSPHGIAVSRDGSRVWVTCEGSGAVLELDAGSGRVLHAWATGQEISHMLAPTPDERKLYVANIRSGSVTVIDRARGTVRSVATGAGAEGIAVSPDGREVWVTNRSANTVSVIDAATDTVVATLDAHGEFPIRVVFTPDGREAWVSVARANAVAVFDAGAREHRATVAVGAMPVGILMAPDGDRAFVANTNDDLVTVLDVPARAVRGTFTTGREPDGMAWARAVSKNPAVQRPKSKKGT
jgi:YVTN family beta-propeller protein